MKFLTILDYSYGKTKIINLDKEDIESYEQFDDTEEFMYTIEDKYDFKVSQCSWMLTDKINLEIL